MRILILLMSLILASQFLYAQKENKTKSNFIQIKKCENIFIKKYEIEKEPFFMLTNNKNNGWSLDSSYRYNGFETQWDLVYRNKTLVFDGNGNILNAISHFWLDDVKSWGKRDTIIMAYHSEESRAKTLKKCWNNSNQSWSDTSYYRKTDENGDTREYIYRTWNYSSNTFNEFGYRYKHIFDNNGIEVKYIEHDWNSETKEWTKASQFLYSYDINYNQIEEIEQIWDNNISAWMNYHKYSNTFDVNGNKISKQKKRWDENANSWEIASSQYLYVYDENNNLLKESLQKWDYNTNEWGVFSYQTIYTYNSNGYLTHKLALSYGINNYQDYYIYDNNGNLLSKLGQSWNEDTEEWINGSLREYEYDTNGNETHELVKYWNNELSLWENSSQHMEFFDIYNNSIQFITQNWNNETNSWDNNGKTDNFWSETSSDISSINIQNLEIYPNPAINEVTIKGINQNENVNIEIISLFGKVVQSEVLNNHNIINISNLRHGLYFVIIRFDNEQIVQKIIKL